MGDNEELPWTLLDEWTKAMVRAQDLVLVNKQNLEDSRKLLAELYEMKPK